MKASIAAKLISILWREIFLQTDSLPLPCMKFIVWTIINYSIFETKSPWSIASHFDGSARWRATSKKKRNEERRNGAKRPTLRLQRGELWRDHQQRSHLEPDGNGPVQSTPEKNPEGRRWRLSVLCNRRRNKRTPLDKLRSIETQTEPKLQHRNTGANYLKLIQRAKKKALLKNYQSNCAN